MIYKEKPDDFSPQFQVVSCYVRHGGTFLLLRRTDDKTQGGKWGIVAGKVDEGETALEAVVRELWEETGIRAVPADMKYFGNLNVNHPALRPAGGYDFVYHMFSLDLDAKPAIQLSLTEHRDSTWATPEQAKEMELVDDLDECNRIFFASSK